GAALFGEKADSFGQAIQQLSTPGIDGMPNADFWGFKFEPLRASSADAARDHWKNLLAPVRTAIANLECCRKEATANRELLDSFLFGARRMELRYQRELDRLQAALAYRNAYRGPWSETFRWVERTEEALRPGRDALDSLRRQFAELWHGENKP